MAGPLSFEFTFDQVTGEPAIAISQAYPSGAAQTLVVFRPEVPALLSFLRRGYAECACLRDLATWRAFKEADHCP